MKYQNFDNIYLFTLHEHHECYYDCKHIANVI